MRVVAVIQARLSSRRLPGKVLLPLAGRPLLSYLLASLDACTTLDDIVIATSTESSDDAIAAFASSDSVACFRGALDDVAARMLGASNEMNADAIVRVNADSPLLDPILVDRGVELYRSEPVDIVTNAFPRTFPKGQGVEVISSNALERSIRDMRSIDEREHVTRHIYSHSERFLVRSFTAASPRPEVQLSVDDAADLEHCEAIISALALPPWQAGWEACVAASDSLSVRHKRATAQGAG